MAEVIVAAPKETKPGETRIPLVPETVKKLVAAGMQVRVESGIGAACNFSDPEYREAGAEVAVDRPRLLGEADTVLRLNKPPLDEIDLLKSGCVHISYLDPFSDKTLIQKLADAGVQAVSMELIPRSTRAQKMDALSSQASLAGYVAVIMAAERLGSIFPMMTTPAGTIQPARVFIIGAGVAGLQAIATAKRLGARVDAFDTRPVVEEQVKSLGARFVKVDLGSQEQTKDGYAKELTEEQLEKQREVMANQCALSDIVITTAQVFGRRAPLIITQRMIDRMKPGAVIIDMAVETGGNVEGSSLDREITKNGVTILGYSNLAGRVPVTSSRMYSSNLGSFVTEFWNKERGTLDLNPADEIISGCMVTSGGRIVNKKLG
ncbi:MAG: Re/Si-specific NAD(P)(+) transhydrogenase subunit alpha [Spirochaetales bacterium]|nr:Re/Si-specific NAD(P)(+) transhydrogenase subunit alpha [Spirochaetales bacterium]